MCLKIMQIAVSVLYVVLNLWAQHCYLVGMPVPVQTACNFCRIVHYVEDSSPVPFPSKATIELASSMSLGKW